MDKQAEIQKQTEELLAQMKIQSTVAVTTEGELFKIQIEENEDSSLLIGRFGSGLRSLQTILEVALFRTLGQSIDLMVNIGDYRERQKVRVEGIAKGAASQVIDENREALLRDFSAFERKLIHEYIATNFPTLTSVSEGEGRERVLVIKKK